VYHDLILLSFSEISTARLRRTLAAYSLVLIRETLILLLEGIIVQQLYKGADQITLSSAKSALAIFTNLFRKDLFDKYFIDIAKLRQEQMDSILNGK
jgi:hypothetical protein